MADFWCSFSKSSTLWSALTLQMIRWPPDFMNDLCSQFYKLFIQRKKGILLSFRFWVNSSFFCLILQKRLFWKANFSHTIIDLSIFRKFFANNLVPSVVLHHRLSFCVLLNPFGCFKVFLIWPDIARPFFAKSVQSTPHLPPHISRATSVTPLFYFTFYFHICTSIFVGILKAGLS